MRGRVDAQSELFHTFNLEELILADHPLRQIRKRADAVLTGMSRQFNAAYQVAKNVQQNPFSAAGRPGGLSCPPCCSVGPPCPTRAPSGRERRA